MNGQQALQLFRIERGEDGKKKGLVKMCIEIILKANGPVGKQADVGDEFGITAVYGLGDIEKKSLVIVRLGGKAL